MKKITLVALVALVLLVLGALPALANDGNGDNSTASVDLEVDVQSPPVTGGGGISSPSYGSVNTNYCGVSGTFQIDRYGKVIKTVTVGCEDGPLTITVEKGTYAKHEDGTPLRLLTIHKDENPPDPPEGANIITIPYTLEPSGATFNPALTFTWTYDELPEGAEEDSLVIAFYNGEEWIEFDCVVDTENKTITALVDHFTTFALLVTMHEEVIEEVVEEPEVTEPEKPVTEPPEPDKEEPEVIELEIAEEEPAAQFPWWIVGAVLGLSLLIGFLFWRRKRD